MISSNKLYLKSYEVTLIMLVCVTVLVFLRSIRQDVSQKASLSLQLAGFVTMIASMHYYLMTKNKENVHVYRYFDWFFTTPILLIDLCLLFDIYDISFITEIILYNTAMLGIGYAGEMGLIGMASSTVVGFIPLMAIFVRLRNKLVDKNISREKWVLFNTFFGLWSLYGINNLVTNRVLSNTIFNILDFLTKGAFALYIYKESW